MNKFLSYCFCLSVIFFLSGCATTGGGANSAAGVNAQMGVLADEVTRLDQALQETRAQLQMEQARTAELEARLGGAPAAYNGGNSAPSYSAMTTEPYAGVYRTPAGFELPAASIQKALKNAGYYSGDVDGKIGPDTREAVRSFQRDNGMTPDGIVGKSTWNRLKTHLDASGG